MEGRCENVYIDRNDTRRVSGVAVEETPGRSIPEARMKPGHEVTQYYPTHLSLCLSHSLRFSLRKAFISYCARISNNQVNRTYHCADVANSRMQLLRKYDHRIIRDDKPSHVVQYTLYLFPLIHLFFHLSLFESQF